MIRDMGLGWPMTGRVEELAFIAAATRGGAASAGVVLAGESGVGKTRLAREAVHAASARGAIVRWAVGTESARGLPLGAFAALPGVLGGDTAWALREAAAALLDGADTAGVVVGVDDAHLLDQLSAALVHHLVVQQLATVVLTVRTGEDCPDAVTALWKDGHVDRLDVQPLTPDQTGALLENVLGGPVDSAAVHRIWKITSGNALYLRQVVDAEREAGRLCSERGVWRWNGTHVVSPGLAELVAARMGELSDPVRAVVDVLALSEPIGVALLASLTDADAVELAEERGVVQVEGDGRRLNARFAHPLFGEVQRASIGNLRARRLRGRIATALADTGMRRAEDTLRRAVLELDSDISPDPGMLAAAAGIAIGLLDLPLAERLARAAVDLGAGFDARLTLAKALSWLSCGVEADKELRALIDLARDDTERVAAVLPCAANLFYTLHRSDEAQTVVVEAAESITDPTAMRVLSALRAAFHVHLGRPSEAVDSATEALAADELPDPAVVLASFGYVAGLGLLGRVDETATVAARAYAAGARSFDAAVPCFGLAQMHLTVLRLAGYLDRASQIATEHRQVSAEIPGPPQVYGIVLIGQAALAEGKLDTATRWFREARAGLADSDTSGFVSTCLLGLAQARAMAGDVDGARTALTELLGDRLPPMIGYLEPEIQLACAWVAAAEGTVSDAISVARRAADIAAGWQQLAHEVLARHTAVCFGDHSQAERLAYLAAHVDGPRVGAAAAHAAALADNDAVALHNVSLRLERMGDLLAAADAEAQAAAVHGAVDRRTAAQTCAARARRLATHCENARTPALLAAQYPLPFTDREREIVTMATKGLTNQQIADRLVVSVRTVEGHLYRAGAKVGVRTRTEFAALLGE